MKTREIKFRAWDRQNDEMLYSQTYPRPHGEQYDETNIYFYPHETEDAVWKIYEHSDKDTEIIFLPDCVVMQFTGLYDKHGKEVYEGDKVSVIDGADGLIHELKDGVYIVKYSVIDCAFVLETLDGGGGILFGECCEYEVIGNIYETAEA